MPPITGTGIVEMAADIFPINETIYKLNQIDQSEDAFKGDWNRLKRQTASAGVLSLGTFGFFYAFKDHVKSWDTDASSFDEMFQVQIIGDGIKKISNAKERVRYKPDAILPDKGVEEWVIHTSKDFTNRIIAETEKGN